MQHPTENAKLTGDGESGASGDGLTTDAKKQEVATDAKKQEGPAPSAKKQE